MRFDLREVGGRLCLPAEAFLDQSMDCGFELVASAGLGTSALAHDKGGGKGKELRGEVLEGEAARQAFSRLERPAAEPN